MLHSTHIQLGWKNYNIMLLNSAHTTLNPVCQQTNKHKFLTTSATLILTLSAQTSSESYFYPTCIFHFSLAKPISYTVVQSNPNHYLSLCFSLLFGVFKYAHWKQESVGSQMRNSPLSGWKRMDTVLQPCADQQAEWKSNLLHELRKRQFKHSFTVLPLENRGQLKSGFLHVELGLQLGHCWCVLQLLHLLDMNCFQQKSNCQLNRCWVLTCTEAEIKLMQITPEMKRNLTAGEKNKTTMPDCQDGGEFCSS